GKGSVGVQLSLKMGKELQTRKAEYPAWFSPPIQVKLASRTSLPYPEFKIPDLLAKGQQETISFLCWSTTRNTLALQVREENNDPCFVCTVTPVPVEEAEKELRNPNAKPNTTSNARKILAACRVTVTVFERRSDNAMMELGPFRRKLLVSDNG